MQFFSSDLLQHRKIRNDRLCMRRSKQMGFKGDSKGKRAVPFDTSFGFRFGFHVIERYGVRFFANGNVSVFIIWNWVKVMRLVFYYCTMPLEDNDSVYVRSVSNS